MGTLLLVATPDVDQVVRVDRCRHYYQTITRHVAAPHEVFIGEKVKIGAKEDYSIIQWPFHEMSITNCEFWIHQSCWQFFYYEIEVFDWDQTRQKKLQPLKKQQKKLWKKIRSFRIQDWWLTCDEPVTNQQFGWTTAL